MCSEVFGRLAFKVVISCDLSTLEVLSHGRGVVIHIEDLYRSAGIQMLGDYPSFEGIKISQWIFVPKI